jgi:acyl-CoA thioester hydrolase
MDEIKVPKKIKVLISVRDYECDMAMGVNNSVYMNYLEHCRHEYLKTMGIDFAEYAKRKIGLVLIRAEIDYKFSLVSGNSFYVLTSMSRVSKLRFQFNQEIYLEPSDKLILSASITGTVVDENNRPKMPEDLGKLLDSQFET